MRSLIGKFVQGVAGSGFGFAVVGLSLVTASVLAPPASATPRTAPGSDVPVSAGAPASAQAIPGGFYCGNATSPVVCIPCRPDKGEPTCAYAPFESAATAMRYVMIDNHASGGERCRLYVDGVGLYNWIYIDAGDSSEHEIGTIPAGRGYNVRCQARAAQPSDAGIGGVIYYY
ncbi:hypothetical protein ACGFMK_13820 [Amycolatopsis sp. NPDC049252]|uniref:hypothetical protein n=1 Tax=Amycolatopsis sp. NPDC049252 TaxID=3363933 RepID=UPI003717B421